MRLRRTPAYERKFSTDRAWRLRSDRGRNKRGQSSGGLHLPVATGIEVQGIAFGVGQPEYVVTLPDYRNRGLIRKLFEMLHAQQAGRSPCTGDYRYFILLSSIWLRVCPGIGRAQSHLSFTHPQSARVHFRNLIRYECDP